MKPIPTEKLQHSSANSDSEIQSQGGRSRRIEVLLSRILGVGVVASLCFVVVGTALSFVHHPGYISDPAQLRDLIAVGSSFPHSIGDVVRGVLDFRGQAIVAFGLLLLIATPVLRVAASITGFVYLKDLRYVIFTTVVLILLLFSFVLGGAEA